MLHAIMSRLDTLTRKVDTVRDEVFVRLDAINTAITKGFKNAMTDLATIASQLNDVTNKLADDVAADRAERASLLSQLASLKAAGQPPTQDQLDGLSTSISRLSLMESTLRTMGTDPANPVPTAAPAVPSSTTDVATAPVTTPADPSTPTT